VALLQVASYFIETLYSVTLVTRHSLTFLANMIPMSTTGELLIGTRRTADSTKVAHAGLTIIMAATALNQNYFGVEFLGE